MADWAFETAAREAAFERLDELTRLYGETVPWAALKHGFQFQGQSINWVFANRGIFFPAGWSIPMSILTSPANPYGDNWAYAGGLLYKYKGTDPSHRDNVGLRRAMEARAGLIYFYAVAKGEYLPVWPVYVVAADDAALTFTIVDAHDAAARIPSLAAEGPRRAYALRLVKQRLHQVAFRRQVITAYRERCAVCRLRRAELLDAAHILRDRDPRSTPETRHGLSLCKLHHAAFDRNIVGVRPDYVVEVRGDVLEQKDGPMLEHGLRGFQGSQLILPPRVADHPRREFLEERYEEFRAAG